MDSILSPGVAHQNVTRNDQGSIGLGHEEMSLLSTLWLVESLLSNQVWHERIVSIGGGKAGCRLTGGVTPREWRGQLPRIAAAPRREPFLFMELHSASGVELSIYPLSGTSIWFKDLVIYLSLFWEFHVSGSTISFSTKSSIYPSSGDPFWFSDLCLNKFNSESHKNLHSIQFWSHIRTSLRFESIRKKMYSITINI